MGGKSRAKKGRESQAASSLPKRSVTSNAPVTAGSGADAIEASVARELANNKPDHEVKETITAATPNSEIEKQVEEPVPKQGEIHLYPVIVKTQNGEKLELQLSPGDSVMDVRQFLLDAQATCFFTCYDLLLCSKDGSAHHLEDYNEISDVADITTGECHLEMTAASYDDRSIRAHVHRTRDLLSLSSLHSSVSTSLALHHETGQSTSANSRDTVKVEVADFDKLGFLEDTSDLLPDLFVPPHQEVHCVESIEFSSFNPPPSYRRLSGDLIYLDVVTLEGNKYCITGSTKHFYVNSSSPNILDPRPSKSTFEATTLAGLLQKLSSKFKKAFQEILDQRASAHPFENVQSLMPPNSWLSPHPIPGHKRDAARAESAVTLSFGSELIGMQRDWNEELQSCREFPHVKPQERILRDRALYKVTTDFVEAAVNGAVGVISRCIPPINPTDPECFHMYVHNNIFFSFAVDAEVEKLFKRQESDSVSSTAGPISSAEKDVIKEKQLADNEQATYASANNDLQGTKAYQEADIPGLYNLAMVVIDYRGHRVIAQSVLPGILQGDKSDSLLYGSVDSGKKISWTEEFHSKVTEAAKRLHLKEHSVLDGSGNAFTLAAPVECKGIVGSDDRHYLLDLMRVTPRDANYTEPGSRYCILRPELISAFYQVEATEKLKSQSKPENDAETENAAETNSEEQNTKESDSKKAIEDIRFNPNVFADVNLAGSPEEIAADEENVRKASLYLKDVVLQKFISDLCTLEVSPMDGQTLTEALHANGINVRYIGKIAEGARAFPHLWDLCSNEIIVRSAKHILKDVLRDTEDHDIGNAVVHFLNCLFGNVAKVVGSTTNSKGQKKDNSWKSAKNQEKTKKITPSWKNQSPQHSNITSDGLWSDIREFAKFKYQFELQDDPKSRAKKIPVIRNLCQKVGIKIAARTYDLHAVAPFQVSDIMDLQPVVKHAVPFSSEAKDLIECGKVHLAEGMLGEAYSSFSDAFTILQQVTGPMHREVANCCRYLAMVLYHAGDMGGAIVQQHKELIINERCLGLDHPDTAHSYGNMALFYHGLNKTELALRHMARALLLLSLSSGPDHPDIAATFINVAMMYQDIGNINKALRYLQGALEKNIMLLGGEHIQTAVCYHALAILYNCTGLYKLSLQNEQKTYDILMKKLGPDDSRTKDSQNWLNTFRMREVQANAQKQKGQVSTQKAMEIFQAHPELIHALQAVAGGGGSGGGGGGGTASSNGSAKSLSASIMGDSLPSRGRGVDERAARAAAEARKKAAARGLVVRPHGVSGPALPPLTRLINMINSGVQTESTNFEANITGVNGEVKDKDKVNSSQHDVNGEVRDKVKVKVKDKFNSSQHSGNGEVKDKDKANSSQQHETPIGLGSGLNKKMKSKDI